jgi:hypothetical protein
MGMTRLAAFVAGSGLSVLLLAAAGCGTNIPPKLEVRDPNSGRSYQTYQSWGQVEKGVGYGFTDIETGSRITLTNYEIRTIEPKKTVPGDSAEAKAFELAKARGGIK